MPAVQTVVLARQSYQPNDGDAAAFKYPAADRLIMGAFNNCIVILNAYIVILNAVKDLLDGRVRRFFTSFRMTHCTVQNDALHCSE